MANTNDKQCIGCGDYENECIIKYIEKGECPCRICLVKTMCEDACEEFILFTNIKEGFA